MLDADWRVHEAGGVTLVATVVGNPTPVDRRVVLHSLLDGPVMPPRRRGVPEAGWTDGGFAGVVPADGRLALGFACRGASTDPPVEVVDEGRVTEAEEPDAGGDDGPSPTDLLRELGSPAPPRDAVPVDDDGPGDLDGQDRDDEQEPRVPGPVADWLDDVAGRVERGEPSDGEAAALRVVAARARVLADRCADRAAVPVGEGRRSA